MREKCFKEIVWSEQDRNATAALFMKLKTLRSDKKMKREIKTKAIQEIKENINSYQQTFFGFKMPLGKQSVTITWRETHITRDEIVKAKNELFKEIRQKRKASRTFKEEQRNLFGYRYTTVGGVLKTKGIIESLVGTVSEETRLRAVKAPHKFQQENFVGVEIECIVKCSNEYLQDKFIEASLQSYVQIKGDSSINDYDEDEHGVEIVLLAKENEMKDIITRVCTVLASKRIKARANNSCGLHVHLDMRHRNVKESYKKLYYGQNILLGMVPENRRTGQEAERYCQKNLTPDYDKHVGKSRYHVINTESYSKYKTLEIRVHSGTTNATKIVNWVAILMSIVNKQECELSYPIKSIDKFIKEFDINSILADYIKKRIDKFETKTLNEVDYEISA